MSSLSFIGNATSYLRIPNSNTFNFGTGDFTIEWYQYQTDNNYFPRIFQVGYYNGIEIGISIGVSIESGIFYYWRNDSPTAVTTLASSVYKNKWVHFAISRSSGTTKIFMNGTLIASLSDTTDFNNTTYDFIIGNEYNPISNYVNDTPFGGYITYFTWVKGTALYTSNFTVSNTYPTLTAQYILLLKATEFIGTLGNTVVNSNVTTVQNVPPNFLSSGGGNTTPPSVRMYMPMFSDNTRVYYKRGSLAPGGVGSVRNLSAKRRKT